MSISIGMEKNVQPAVRIKVFGIGGAGNNAINRMASGSFVGLDGVSLVAVNTDVQDLEACNATEKIAIGKKLTRGFGAGADPLVGEHAAEENIEEIKQALQDTDLLLISAGMGGGTGTGASPIVASVAKDMGILTVALVTKPFPFESKLRMKIAENGIEKLKDNVDSIAVILNDQLLHMSDEKLPIKQAFELSDSVLVQAVQSIIYIIRKNGYVNVDFKDIESVLRGGGVTHIGVGRASGENMLMDAAKIAVSSPLLETPIDKATAIMIHCTCPDTVDLSDVSDACTFIREHTDEARLRADIFGITNDPDLNDEVCFTVIATGLANESGSRRSHVSASGESPASASTEISSDEGLRAEQEFFDVFHR